jgi:hypothetical protein
MKTLQTALLRVEAVDRAAQGLIEDLLEQIETENIDRELPMVKWIESEESLTLFLLAHAREGIGQFFYDLSSHWLLPGKKLRIPLFFTTDFQLPDLGERFYTLSKIVVAPEEEEELEQIKENLQVVQAELRLGAVSLYHATRLLETRGMSVDEKRALIQQRISALAKQKPEEFDYDIFSEMQHFFVMCGDAFKEVRESTHVARMIEAFYLMRKRLERRVDLEPLRRHLSIKFVKSRLNLPLGATDVLGIFIGINFLTEHERCEEEHIVRAIQNCLPDAKLVEGSSFTSLKKNSRIQVMYLEVEKKGAEPFTLQALLELKKKLPMQLRNSVQQLMPSLFMPRNEEEVMRNILTLAGQLKYRNDIPQVIISFDGQTDTELCFTVVVARVISPGTPSLDDVFKSIATTLSFSLDRTRIVGMLRKRLPKEANVLRTRVSYRDFVREDLTVDLYKARQYLLQELQKILGEVRDFNGGMLAKQIEAYQALKSRFGTMSQQHELLLENFFHSISPVEKRSILPPGPLQKLFLMLLNLMESGKEIANAEEQGYLLTAVKEGHEKFLVSPQTITVSLPHGDQRYMGYIRLS